MPTEAKRETVAELREELSRSTTMIVSEYRGLKVRELGEIRRNLRKQNVSYQVVKNRLMRIAAADGDAAALSSLLEGPTAIAFGSGDAGTVARAVLAAVRPYRLVRVKGAVIGRTAVDAEGVTRLSTLPSREELLGRLAGAIQSPTATMAGLLAAPLRNLGYALQQVADQKAQAAKA
jgi:large subunit ribosomal protein L10